MRGKATDFIFQWHRSSAGISGSDRLAHAEVACHDVRTTKCPRQYPFGAPQSDSADCGESRNYLIAGQSIQNSYSQFTRRDLARDINDVLRFTVGKLKGANICHFESGYSGGVETVNYIAVYFMRATEGLGQAPPTGCRPAQVHLLGAYTSKQGTEEIRLPDRSHSRITGIERADKRIAPRQFAEVRQRHYEHRAHDVRNFLAMACVFECHAYFERVADALEGARVCDRFRVNHNRAREGAPVPSIEQIVARAAKHLERRGVVDRSVDPYCELNWRHGGGTRSCGRAQARRLSISALAS